ncbi:hypothetical protein L211DRAFT_168182 [Terfezia boudieri ATCC MYA-4762]|uniref:Uncharacterized protein n=1 Tax=Terfezia boudieri ATCC MYA-4762 TaxID=1051890 RepID=A0A3N4LTB9_9PEZI|nr:hypothetical protein L211DRAFT_168182 [Terfezia boudieri ATCC MYA-4762]
MVQPPSPWSEYYAIVPITNITILLARNALRTIRGFDKDDIFNVHYISITSSSATLGRLCKDLWGKLPLPRWRLRRLPCQNCSYQCRNVSGSPTMSIARERMGIYRFSFKDIPGSWQSLTRLSMIPEEGILVGIDAVVVSRPGDEPAIRDHANRVMGIVGFLFRNLYGYISVVECQ